MFDTTCHIFDTAYHILDITDLIYAIIVSIAKVKLLAEGSKVTSKVTEDGNKTNNLPITRLKSYPLNQ